MIYLVNIILSVLLTFFSLGIYTQGEGPGALVVIVVFLCWYVLTWLMSYFYDRAGHFKKLPKIIGLVIFYFRQLFLASFWVAYDVLTRKELAKPGIIAFPLQARTDLEITLLANLITLTPGSLSIDVSNDRRILYVHDIYIKDGDLAKKKREIKNGFEKRILDITR